MSIFELAVIADSILADPTQKGGINIPTATADDAKLKAILYFIFGIIAAISFLMVVIGGFKYVISIGDPQKITTARKTIMYSLIGLAVSLSAITIVAFVINNV